MTSTLKLTILAGALFVAGCSDPLRDMPRLSDIEVEETATPQAADPAPRRPGLFRRMFSRSQDTLIDDAVRAAAADATDAPDTTGAEDTAPAQSDTPERPGLFASIFRARGTTSDSPRRAGAPYTGPDAQLAEAGQKLPFGEIGRVCDLPRNQRGSRIAKIGRLEIWDPVPNSTAPRPHYITGFSDGCARSFTSALTMPGDPLLHETERYSSRAAYTAADDAYEQAKRQVCGVGRGTSCGDAMPRLERQIAMISAYESFGSGARSATIIIFKGRVTAMSIRER